MGLFENRTLTVSVACALGLACARTPMVLTPEGERVRVSDSASVERCEYLGNYAPEGVGPRRAPNPWASNQVRNLAAKHGATDLIWDTASGDNPIGKAYRCP